MAMSAASMSIKMQDALTAAITIVDSVQLQKVCDAISEAVVSEIQNNASVEVTGVTAGGDTAGGTVS